MADVRILCVREDVDRAYALAESFEAADLSVADEPHEDAAVTVLVWSEQAGHSRVFLRAASASAPDKTLIASFVPGPTHASVFDLSTGDACMARALVRAVQQKASRVVAEETISVEPERVAPVIKSASHGASGWRDINPSPPYRRMGAALAFALIAMIGVQFKPAEIAQPTSAMTEAPVVFAEAAAYEPALTAEDVMIEPRPEQVEPPRGLLEPASAPDQTTPPPYRSWDHEPQVASVEVETLSLAANTQTFEARFKRAPETPVMFDDIEPTGLWQAAAYTP